MIKTFDREKMLQRAKERGGTASMIVCAISNDFKNSDLRADNPAIMRAFNERFEYLESQRDDLLKALKFARAYIGEEIHIADRLDAAIAKAEGK